MNARDVLLGIFVFAGALILLVGLSSLAREAPVGSSVPSLQASSAAIPSSSVPGGPSASASSVPPSVAASSGASATTGAGPSASLDAGPTAPPPADAILVGAGDIADCDRDADEQTGRLLDGIAGNVFTAGDNVYPTGTAAQFRDCYAPTWGRQLARTRPAPGNHDWLTPDLAGYRGYFGGSAGPDEVSWYSYDLGAWHIVVLDSDCEQVDGCGADSAQGRWLAADLAGTHATCTMAIWHHPRFSSGEHGNDDAVAPFWQLLYDAGADVVVNGHDHDYERFAPQDPAARPDEARGLREFVVGTGGAALRDLRARVANSVVASASVFGVIRFVLRPTGYDWRFLSTTGAFVDSGSAECHG